MAETKHERKAKLAWWMHHLANYLPPSQIGVSLSFLQSFVARRPHVARLRTEEVVDAVIKPETMKRRCAYVDMLRGTSSGGEIGPSTIFVSHAWKYPWEVLVQTISGWEKEHMSRKDSFYWIDIICKNQHDVAASSSEAIDAEFRVSISSAWGEHVMQPQLLFVVHPWPDPIAIKRIWCLFEIMYGMLCKASLNLAFSTQVCACVCRVCLTLATDPVADTDTDTDTHVAM
jgi:hypothetical protein